MSNKVLNERVQKVAGGKEAEAKAVCCTGSFCVSVVLEKKNKNPCLSPTKSATLKKTCPFTHRARNCFLLGSFSEWKLSSSAPSRGPISSLRSVGPRLTRQPGAPTSPRLSSSPGTTVPSLVWMRTAHATQRPWGEVTGKTRPRTPELTEAKQPCVDPESGFRKGGAPTFGWEASSCLSH